MNDIYLSKYRIKNLEPLSDKSKGVNGVCYKYKNGVIKIFRYDLNSHYKENILSHLKKDSKIILWPKALVFEKGFFTDKLKGYYMDKAPNDNLLNIRNKVLHDNMDITFDQILYIYYDKFLPELKNENVLLSDVKMGHIFLDDNLYLTDTDNFTIEEKSGEIYKCNLSQVNFCMKMLFDNLMNSSLRNNINYKNTYEDEFIYDMIKNIRSKTNGEACSLLSLKNYNNC